MGCFAVRLLITINALMPVYCFHKAIQQVLVPLIGNREMDLKSLMSLILYSTRFLTNWAVMMQLYCMIGYLVHDVMEMMDVAQDFRSRLKSHLDKFFYSIGSSISFFVSIAYWGLYIYDIELITFTLPNIGDGIVLPLGIDLGVHLLGSVNTLLHMWNDENFIRQENKYWPQVYFCFIYVSWFYLLNWIEELPVYPIVDRTEEPYRILSLLCASFVWPLLDNIAHSIGRKVYLCRNAKDYQEKEKEK